jgi:D-amino-acid dehydrogenase
VRADAPVVVIGGGCVGLSAALFLARGGADVVIAERSLRLDGDAASGSAGLLTPSHCVPLAGPGVLRRLPAMLRGKGMISVRPRLDRRMLRFGALAARAGRGERKLAGLRALLEQSRASLELYADFAADRPELEFRRNGVMNVCATGEAMEELVAEAELIAREGLEPRLLDGTEAAALEPTLRDDLAGAVFWKDDGSMAPDATIAALAEAASEAGARLALGSSPRGFRRGEDGSVVEVTLGEERIAPRAVVIAAGAGTPGVAAALGARVPIEPAKGHHFQLASFGPQPRIPMILQEQAMGFCAIGTGVRMTGGMDFAGDRPGVEDRRIADIKRLIGDYIADPPGEEGGAYAAQWAGMRPCTPDGLPIVGWMRRSPNTMIAAGHGMLGFTLGPATGRDVANLILGRPDSAEGAGWLAQCAPARFGL